MQGRQRHHLAILLLLIIMLPQSAALNISPDDADEWVSVEGGWSVLVEERTAVWCPSCVEIDPYLRQVQESHGSRMILVGLHPDDGLDPFGNQYSEQRLAKLSNQTGTPAFHVDGEFIGEGSQIWPDVQSALLKTESQATGYRPITLTILEQNEKVHWNVSTQIGDDENLTILILANGLPVPKDVENPGGETRDNVLVYTSEMSSGSFSLPSGIEGYSVIALVEDGSNTLGAVEARVLPLSDENPKRGLWPLAILLCLGAVLVLPRKVDAISQEEE